MKRPAVAELVSALNDATYQGTYAYVSLDAEQLGSDAITVGMIYKPAVVSLVGETATTSAAPFDYGNRQPLVQTFEQVSSGEQFTLAVNHFKSKSCGSASGLNEDQSDGQGCWNEVRKEAASGLVSWLSTYPTGIEDDDILIVGDLNAYGKEDPINLITASGYHDLLAERIGVNAYSYSFWW